MAGEISYKDLKREFRNAKQELSKAKRLSLGTNENENIQRILSIEAANSRLRNLGYELMSYRYKHFNPLKTVLLNFLDGLYSDKI